MYFRFTAIICTGLAASAFSTALVSQEGEKRGYDSHKYVDQESWTVDPMPQPVIPHGSVVQELRRYIPDSSNVMDTSYIPIVSHALADANKNIQKAWSQSGQLRRVSNKTNKALAAKDGDGDTAAAPVLPAMDLKAVVAPITATTQAITTATNRLGIANLGVQNPAESVCNLKSLNTAAAALADTIGSLKDTMSTIASTISAGTDAADVAGLAEPIKDLKGQVFSFSRVLTGSLQKLRQGCGSNADVAGMTKAVTGLGSLNSQLGRLVTQVSGAIAPVTAVVPVPVAGPALSDPALLLVTPLADQKVVGGAKTTSSDSANDTLSSIASLKEATNKLSAMIEVLVSNGAGTGTTSRGPTDLTVPMKGVLNVLEQVLKLVRKLVPKSAQIHLDEETPKESAGELKSTIGQGSNNGKPGLIEGLVAVFPSLGSLQGAQPTTESVEAEKAAVEDAATKEVRKDAEVGDDMNRQSEQTRVEKVRVQKRAVPSLGNRFKGFRGPKAKAKKFAAKHGLFRKGIKHSLVKNPYRKFPSSRPNARLRTKPVTPEHIRDRINRLPQLMRTIAQRMIHPMAAEAVTTFGNTLQKATDRLPVAKLAALVNDARSPHSADAKKVLAAITALEVKLEPILQDVPGLPPGGEVTPTQPAKDGNKTDGNAAKEKTELDAKVENGGENAVPLAST